MDLPPSARAAASSPQKGNIARLHVQPGQRVTKGTLLAEVQSLELHDLQRSWWSEELAIRLLEHQVAVLRSPGIAVARRRLWELDATLTTARQKRATARRRLEILGFTTTQLEDSLARFDPLQMLLVLAPMDGVVVDFEKAIEQAVQAETPLFHIHDLTQARVKKFLSERQRESVTLGQTARVRFATNPDTAYKGQLDSHTGKFSDPMLAFWIELDSNPRRLLRQGQMARVSLMLPNNQSSMATNSTTTVPLAVPLTAVVRVDHRNVVFVRQPNGVFVQRTVPVGRANDERVKILSGLIAGENVAIRGANALQTAYVSLR